MKVPARILKGTGGSGGAYLLDASFNPMTVLSGGVGAVLVDNAGVDLPTVTWDASTFDAMQAYFVGRKAAFDALAACETCPEQLTAKIGEDVGLDKAGIDEAIDWAMVILADLRAPADATG